MTPDPSELCAITVELIRRDAFSLIVIPFEEYLDSKLGLHAGVRGQ